MDQQIASANAANEAAYKRMNDAKRSEDKALKNKLTKAWETTRDETEILRTMKKNKVDRKTAEAKLGRAVKKNQAEAAEKDRKWENRQRGRSNSRLIEANKNAGNSWEDIKAGRV